MLLIYAYIFALVLGGVLLGASFLLGGDHDADGDVDMDADADVDADVDADADIDGDADGGHDGHGDVAGFFGVLGSLRFWTFFTAFFGLTGLVHQTYDLVGGRVAVFEGLGGGDEIAVDEVQELFHGA